MTIKARFILEAMGEPKELVIETLNKIIESIKEKFKVEESFVEKPKKSGDKFYTTYAEIIISFKNVQLMFEFMTYYTPTIVEVLEPYKFELSAGELENICNDVMSKVHEMDKRLKSILSANRLLTKQVVQRNSKK